MLNLFDDFDLDIQKTSTVVVPAGNTVPDSCGTVCGPFPPTHANTCGASCGCVLTAHSACITEIGCPHPFR